MRYTYHVTYNDRTKRLYMADTENDIYTVMEGSEAEAIHNNIRNKIENPPWAGAYGNHHSSGLKSAR